MKEQKNLAPEYYENSIMPMVWFGIVYGLISSLFLFFILKTKDIRSTSKLGPIHNPKIKLEALTIEENDQEIQYDDLTRIKGIGPVISKILNSHGINSFSDLAKLTDNKIQEILISNKIRLANYESWPGQAKYAANGDWQALEVFQKTL